MYYDQSGYPIRFAWGLRGLEALGPQTDVLVIVDVLSFTTCVDVAVSRGARVFPCAWRDQSAADYAKEVDAILATRRGATEGRFSLSPKSLLEIDDGTRVVLPSPNGSTLTLRAAELGITIAGCLRNAAAVARDANGLGDSIAVIACGERWEDDSLRPAIEDLLGAGAILDALQGERSPEAEVAASAFRATQANLPNTIRRCASGRELIEKGFPEDVEIALELNASRSTPRLIEGRYTAP